MAEAKLTRRAFLKAGLASAAALALGAAMPAPAEALGLADPYAGVVGLTFPIRRGLYWIYRNWHVPRVGTVLLFNHDRGGRLRAHDGVDIYAPKGTPLYACVPGTVVAHARPRYPYGNYVWIQGANGYRFFYCHLDKLNVQVGQQVTRNTLLGTVGKTGNAQSTPAHLHFEIHLPPGNVYSCKYCLSHKHVSSMNPLPSLLAADLRG